MISGRDEVTAEAARGAAVLPLVAACDSIAAAVVFKTCVALGPTNAVRDGYAAAAVESTYKCSASRAPTRGAYPA